MTRPSDYSSTAIYLKNKSKYHRSQRKLIEAHQNKVANIEFRKKALDDRKRLGYMNEYRRLRGLLAHTAVPQQTKRTIEERFKQIQKFELGHDAKYTSIQN